MFRFSKILVVFSLCIIGIGVSIAQDANELPVVTVTYSDEAITVSPSEIPAGLTTLVMENTSNSHQGGPIGRFKDGMTMENLAAEMAKSPFGLIIVFDLYGSLSGGPEDQESITLDLQAGKLRIYWRRRQNGHDDRHRIGIEHGSNPRS